ncbi:MAG TPA: carbohydrate-binding domain-containing protein [Verrucomicrobiae bacterium]
MKRFLRTTMVLVAVCLATTVQAADDQKLELKDGKVKTGEGVGEELAGYDEGEGRIFFYAPAGVEFTFKVAEEGEHKLVIKASCDAAQNENAKFKLTVNGKEDEKETTLKNTEAEEVTVTVKLKAGENKVKIFFTNDAYKEGEYDRNMYIHAVTVKAKK